MPKNIISAGSFLSEEQNIVFMLKALVNRKPPVKKIRKKKSYPKPVGLHRRLEATASYKQYYAKRNR